ncbi:hypothetical protein Q0Z83_053970 [Actinoplanes sichuanensis]|uniref:Condensation domain-containing protein n=1 Tax=Actinoplanes sichuanensis TaxID=512349 RepID=A0ABW4AV13_9ACTN|nr:condensation domain-containing protein [Actinoplanes sichuanensis]BEL07206.1 hypothetical protein Q0Z83_053970 [Actinoplanes sichuanensis]
MSVMSRRLTPEEFSLWIHEQSSDVPSLYSEPTTFLIRGELDAHRLCESVANVLASHPILGASVRLSGVWPVLEAGAEAQLPGPVPLVEYPLPPGADAQERLSDYVRRWWADGLDLEAGVVCRARVLRLGPEIHALALLLHHLVTDGWSMRVLAAEVVASYTGLDTLSSSSSLAPRPSAEAAMPEIGADPGSFADPFPGHTSFGSGGSFAVPCRRWSLPAVAASLGVTPFTLHVAAFQRAIREISGASRYLMVFPESGRRSSDARSVGYFVRTRLLVADLSPSGDGDPAVGQLCDAILDSIEGVSLTPDVQAHLAALGLPAPAVSFAVDLQVDLPIPGCQAEWLPLPLPRAKFPLALLLSQPSDDRTGQTWLVVEHDPARVPETTARAVAERYLQLVAELSDGGRGTP